MDRRTLAPILQISSEVGSPPLSQPSSVSIAADAISERIYIADTGNNRVLQLIIPKDDPLACWNSARQSLIGGNVQAALTQFSGSVVDRYRNLFLSIGTATVAANMQAIGQVTPIYIDDNEARYYFTRTIDAQVFSFVLTTVKENGLWKIRNF